MKQLNSKINADTVRAAPLIKKIKAELSTTANNENEGNEIDLLKKRIRLIENRNKKLKKEYETCWVALNRNFDIKELLEKENKMQKSIIADAKKEIDGLYKKLYENLIYENEKEKYLFANYDEKQDKYLELLKNYNLLQEAQSKGNDLLKRNSINDFLSNKN